MINNKRDNHTNYELWSQINCSNVIEYGCLYIHAYKKRGGERKKKENPVDRTMHYIYMCFSTNRATVRYYFRLPDILVNICNAQEHP